MKTARLAVILGLTAYVVTWVVGSFFFVDSWMRERMQAEIPPMVTPLYVCGCVSEDFTGDQCQTKTVVNVAGEGFPINFGRYHFVRDCKWLPTKGGNYFSRDMSERGGRTLFPPAERMYIQGGQNFYSGWYPIKRVEK